MAERADLRSWVTKSKIESSFLVIVDSHQVLRTFIFSKHALESTYWQNQVKNFKEAITQIILLYSGLGVW